MNDEIENEEQQEPVVEEALQEEVQEEIPEEEVQEETTEEPVHKMTRSEARFNKLANERAEAQAEAKSLREQAEFYRRQLEAKNKPVEDVYVDPDEKWRRETENKVNQALFSANDMNDRATYVAKSGKNPLYDKFSAKVEAELQSIRAKGGNATREGVLSFLVGQDALANAGKQTKTAQKASANVAAARGTTPGMKSNVSQQRSTGSAEERLAGIIL